MRIRFQADADLHQRIVRAVLRREPSMDFQTASAASLSGLPDPAVLALAANEGRVLVSHDQTTMPEHFSRFITTRNSSGLLLVPQRTPPELIVEEIILIWFASEAEEWVNRICYLPL